MKLLEDRIRRDGIVAAGDILRVDSFLNHQVDVPFLDKLAEEFCRLYEGEKIDKVATVEASGITIATLIALRLGVPLVFAKKAKTANIDDSFLSADCYSYTHGIAGKILISRNYLHPGERVLIVDDFLANGEATRAMLELISKAGAETVGICIMVEKSYQPGRKMLDDMGVRVESLARIASMDPENGIEFVE